MSLDWRPANQTEADKQRERAILKAVQNHLGADSYLHLSPYLYEIDAAIVMWDGRVVGWVEAKFRRQLYPEMLLSSAKALRLCALSTLAPAFFAIGTGKGEVYLHKLGHPREYRLGVGGNLRGQNGDLEPVIYVPLKQFALI